jgi:regulator of protease activity HflC (stomatin/prohibitin superfamily)
MWRYVRQNIALDGKSLITNRPITKIDLRETVYEFPKQNVITKDNVGTEINAIIYFQITDPVKAVYEISNLPDAIEKLTQTTLRNVIGELDLDQTLTSRDTINGKLRTVLDEAGHKWGVKVNRVELQDINPPQEIRAAMEKQMRAERDKRAKVLDAEGDKQSQILQSEGKKLAAINNAEGEKQSKILYAEGEAQARIRTAEGEAEAIQKITQAIASSKSDPANYLIALRYIDALKEMVTGKDNKIIYMPYEATGILSSIGGIKDLLTTTNNK